MIAVMARKREGRAADVTSVFKAAAASFPYDRAGVAGKQERRAVWPYPQAAKRNACLSTCSSALTLHFFSHDTKLTIWLFAKMMLRGNAHIHVDQRLCVDP
ncbi:hypothetical protein CBOM_07549 [Ceraceosorus bombacis]|uniref:Uncharacterized protein n=1 Tax=Ceraceosorus bombacis TaxID=401625 RepID=A0A0P1BF43_9BASI|nr:hypothetical protein CBOM_07549 [Ceraceosorus bombacis]